MQRDAELTTFRRRGDDRHSSDATVGALSFGERVLLSLAIEAVCLVVHGTELLGGEGRRGGQVQAVRQQRTRRP